jgi:uncharacterized glyoxalase superfamily protein PhnB
MGAAAIPPGSQLGWTPPPGPGTGSERGEVREPYAMTANTTAKTTATMYPSLSYDDAPAAIAWLERAFGFQRRLVVPGENGKVVHSELSFGAGVIMVSSSKPEQGRIGPRNGPVCQAVCVQVDDPDAHYARAKAAGAEITHELQDEDYGSRGYMARDPEGHQWYFGTYRPGAYW